MFVITEKELAQRLAALHADEALLLAQLNSCKGHIQEVEFWLEQYRKKEG